MYCSRCPQVVISDVLLYTCSKQMSPVIALDIAVVAQKVKVYCWGPVWSEKVGWCWCWVTNRSGWLSELLTELTNQMANRTLNCNQKWQYFSIHSLQSILVLHKENPAFFHEGNSIMPSYDRIFPTNDQQKRNPKKMLLPLLEFYSIYKKYLHVFILFPSKILFLDQ